MGVLSPSSCSSKAFRRWRRCGGVNGPSRSQPASARASATSDNPMAAQIEIRDWSVSSALDRQCVPRSRATTAAQNSQITKSDRSARVKSWAPAAARSMIESNRRCVTGKCPDHVSSGESATRLRSELATRSRDLLPMACSISCASKHHAAQKLRWRPERLSSVAHINHSVFRTWSRQACGGDVPAPDPFTV